MKLQTALSCGLTALPLLFVLAFFALPDPAELSAWPDTPAVASPSTASEPCSDNRRRVLLLVALMPADLPPRLHGRAGDCPV